MRTLYFFPGARGLFRSVSVAAFALGLSACAKNPQANVPSTSAAIVEGPMREVRGGMDKSGQKVPAIASSELRKPGDYVVYRFSGSFRKTPLLLKQKVIRVEGALVTVDVTLAPETKPAEAKATEGKGRAKVEPIARLRVTFDRTPGAIREVSQVTRIEGDHEEPATLEDYEKLMAETVVVPDRNEDTIGSEIVKAQIGNSAIDVKKTSYRVSFGKKTAVMSTLTSDGFAWGDVGGEIRSKDGKVIYLAEIVEMGDAGESKREQKADNTIRERK